MGRMNPSCLCEETLMHAEGENGSVEPHSLELWWFVEVGYFTHFGCLKQNTTFQEEKKPKKTNINCFEKSCSDSFKITFKIYFEINFYLDFLKLYDVPLEKG